MKRLSKQLINMEKLASLLPEGKPITTHQVILKDGMMNKKGKLLNMNSKELQEGHLQDKEKYSFIGIV